MPAFLRWLPLVAAFLLAGCVGMQPLPTSTPEINQKHLASLSSIQGFNMQGRIGVQTEGKGFSGSSNWEHERQSDNISLFSPLGAQVAIIKTAPDGVTLITEDGKTYRAVDVETLTLQNLGWSLPMHGLPDWILGRPTASIIKEQQWDEVGRLTRLKQDGWDIEYSQYIEASGYQLPTKVTLRSPKLNLKLVIERWAISTNQRGSSH